MHATVEDECLNKTKSELGKLDDNAKKEKLHFGENRKYVRSGRF